MFWYSRFELVIIRKLFINSTVNSATIYLFLIARLKLSYWVQLYVRVELKVSHSRWLSFQIALFEDR